MFIVCLSPWRGWQLLPPFGQRPLVLKEGGVRLTVLALRACSYKAKAEAWQQGNAPYSSRGGCRFLLIVMTQIPQIICYYLRNLRNPRENILYPQMTQINTDCCVDNPQNHSVVVEKMTSSAWTVCCSTDSQKPWQTPCAWCKSLTSLLCCSRLQIHEQAQTFSACSTITLRALHQPQGDKPKINISSVAYWK